MRAVLNLKRSLNLPLVALYGLGNILGAGIYVLVGKVAGFAGAGTTLSFLLAMFVAGITAFSYMELAGRYPVSASVSVYLHKAFGRRWLSVLIGLVMVGGGITSAAVLSKGFAGYLSTFVSVPAILASTGLLVMLGYLAIRGMGESAIVASIFTVAEIAGLVLIIASGKEYFSNIELSEVFQVDPGLGLAGVIMGGFLAFYAFIGFEDMVNVSEEVKNPRRTMPIAILFSLIASTVLYLFVVIVSLAVVEPSELAASSAPLSLVYERATSNAPIFIGAIGIAAAINGVIVQIIMGSRILYGLARQGWLHKELARVHKVRRTPVFATIFVTALMILSGLLLPIVALAELTSFLVLVVFCLVNLSLLKIKRHHKNHGGFITVPKVIPLIGVLSCLFMLGYQIFTQINF